MSQNLDATKWECNGHTFELDMQDVDTVEKYEDAFATLSKEELALPKEGKNSTRVRAYCKMFRNLMDNLFGEGANIEIFGEKDNSRAVTEIYDKFLEFIVKQQTEFSNLQNKIQSKYSPNRAQRRAELKVKDGKS